MATVTVASGSGQTTSLTFDSANNAALAQSLVNSITGQLNAGTMSQATGAGGTAPDPAPGTTGLYVQTDSGFLKLTDAYTALIEAAPSATVQGGSANGQSIVSGDGDLTFLSTGGSGTLDTGGGNNRILELTGRGGWSFNTGGGNDTVFAGAGNNTISAGGGENVVMAGNGNNTIVSSGDDRILVGSGHDTVAVHGDGTTQVTGSNGHLTFIGSGTGAATVDGAAGSVTIYAGGGGGEFRGGTAGHNVIYGGSGPTSIEGGGTGDQLTAGAGPTTILAGEGNETLSGALSTANNVFYAGDGKDMIRGGSGNDTIMAGTGAATMTGGLGSDVFTFTSGDAAQVTIRDFHAGEDTLKLDGYGNDEVQNALNGATSANGATTLTLSDNTTITLLNVTHLNQSNFS